MKRAVFFHATLIIALLAAGCWVRKETGEKMQADISALQAELQVLKKFNEEQKAELQRRIEEADARLAELLRLIDDYQRSMGRNSADLGLSLEQLKERIAQLLGRIEVLEYNLGKLQKAAAPAEVKPPEPQNSAPQIKPDPLGMIKRPEKKEDFYKLALSLLENNQLGPARLLFEEFLNRWPEDKLAPNARFWIAESHYREENFRQAALAFQNVRSKFPKSDKAADALGKLGFCFFSMKRYQEAIPFLEQYLQDFPKGSLVSAAKEKLKQARQLAEKKK